MQPIAPLPKPKACLAAITLFLIILITLSSSSLLQVPISHTLSAASASFASLTIITSAPSSAPSLSPASSPPPPLRHLTTTYVKFRGPIPTARAIKWCHEGEDLIYQPLIRRIKDEQRKKKSPVLILLLGDSTMHEPFAYISKCVFGKGVGRARGNTTSMYYTVRDAKVQVIFYPNYWQSLVFSIPGNTARGKLPMFRARAHRTVYEPALVWANFGLLHTLHRFPARLDAGDYAGWQTLEQWVVNEATTLAADYGFPAVLVSTPHSICSKRFTEERLKWMDEFEQGQGSNHTSKACVAYFTKQAVKASKAHGAAGISTEEADVAKYCKQGAGVPRLVKALQRKFDAVVQRGGAMRQALPSTVRFGVMNNTQATEHMCKHRVTPDGVHYESLVPQQVDAMFSFLFT